MKHLGTFDMRSVAQGAIAALLLLAMTFAAAAPADAYGKSFIRIKNETGMYAWITVYSNTKAEGAWCIAPGAYDDHGVTAEIKEVRAEVSAGGCQHPPMLLDKTWGVAAREIVNNDVTFYGFVKLVGGFYIFTH